jgi:hypothetical protein
LKPPQKKRGRKSFYKGPNYYAKNKLFEDTPLDLYPHLPEFKKYLKKKIKITGSESESHEKLKFNFVPYS